MGTAVDAGIFAVSAAMFVSYHLWIFFFKELLQCTKRRHFLVWETSYRARWWFTRHSQSRSANGIWRLFRGMRPLIISTCCLFLHKVHWKRTS